MVCFAAICAVCVRLLSGIFENIQKATARLFVCTPIVFSRAQKVRVKTIQVSERPQFSSSAAAANKKRTQCFLIYFDGGAASIAALNSALDLAELSTLLIVGACAPLSRPAAASNSKLSVETLLALVVKNAAARGLSIQTELLESHDLGRALVNCATRFNADIIFWGVERAEIETGLKPEAKYVVQFASAKVVLVGV